MIKYRAIWGLCFDAPSSGQVTKLVPPEAPHYRESTNSKVCKCFYCRKNRLGLSKKRRRRSELFRKTRSRISDS